MSQHGRLCKANPLGVMCGTSMEVVFIEHVAIAAVVGRFTSHFARDSNVRMGPTEVRYSYVGAEFSCASH